MLAKMLSVFVVLGVAAAAAHAAPIGGIDPRLRPYLPPPGTTVLVYGQEATLTGSLKIKEVEGHKTAVLTELSGKVVERHTLYYPAVMPRPGINPRPRPPFSYVPVTEVVLGGQGRDAVRLAELVGGKAKVRISGKYGYVREASANIRGLTVETAVVRNLTIPQELPTEARFLAVAKKAVRDHLQGETETVIEGEPAAYNTGALIARVTVRVRNGFTGRASHLAFLYDFLTGEVRRAPIAVAL